jgi:Flp pilus assembly protein TadD
MSLLSFGQLEDALAHLTRALELTPDFPQALVLRAMAYRKSRQNDQAMADLDRALSLDPGDASALSERGFVRLLMDNDAEKP